MGNCVSPTFPARWPQRMLARQSRSSRGHSLSARYRSRLRRIRKPPSIPPDHPFLLGHPHSSHPVTFGFWEKPPCQAPLLEPSRFSLEGAALTRRGLPSVLFPGEVLREATSDCGTAPLDGHRGARLPACLAKGRGVRKSDAPGRLAGRRRTPEAPRLGRRRSSRRKITRYEKSPRKKPRLPDGKRGFAVSRAGRAILPSAGTSRRWRGLPSARRFHPTP